MPARSSREPPRHPRYDVRCPCPASAAAAAAHAVSHLHPGACSPRDVSPLEWLVFVTPVSRGRGHGPCSLTSRNNAVDGMLVAGSPRCRAAGGVALAVLLALDPSSAFSPTVPGHLRAAMGPAAAQVPSCPRRRVRLGGLADAASRGCGPALTLAARHTETVQPPLWLADLCRRRRAAAPPRGVPRRPRRGDLRRRRRAGCAGAAAEPRCEHK